MLTKEDIEEFEKFYSVRLVSKPGYVVPAVYVTSLTTGKEKEILFPTLFTFGVAIPKDKVKESIDKVEALKLGPKELVVAFSDNWDEESYEDATSHTDKKTRDYINKIKNSISYVETIDYLKAGNNLVEINTDENNFLVYKLENGTFGVYESSFCPPDDFEEDLHIFSKKPRKSDFEIIKIIRLLEIGFYFKHFEVCFKCINCDKEVHWLDLEGTIKDKYDKLVNQECCEK